MRTLIFGIAVALALLMVPGVLAEGLHVEAKISAHPSVTVSGAPTPTGSNVALPTAPTSVPASAPQIIQLASIQTSAGPSGVGFAAGTGNDAQQDEQAFPGEAIVSAVLPTIEQAGPATVATVGVLALLQAFGAWRFVSVGAIGLYSRLTKSELLDNEHRDRVYKLIQSSPGIGVSEISAATGLGWGTTVYHLDRLERVGFVASERGGLHRCYFPVGTLAREVRKGMGALKADMTRSIAQFLVTRPGATQTELCEALKLSASAASKQVTKLEGAGLVRRERDWKTVHLHPTDALPQLLAGDTPAAMPAVMAAPVAA
ncbi:MAG: MarR family transcriptional regulator [Candidatus Thermoplasmatota archaeon]